MWNRKTLVMKAAIAATAAILVGCGKGPISGEYRADCITGITQNYVGNIPTGTIPGSTPATYPGYPGSTYPPSSPYYAQSQVLSMKATLKFSGDNDVRAKVSTFNSTDCTGAVQSDVEIESTYALGGAITASSTQTGQPQPAAAAVGAQTIDFSTRKVRVKRKTHEQVAFSNTYRECNIVDWQIDKRRDVTGTDCADDWSIAQSPFNIISIQGDRLYLGTSMYGVSAGGISGKSAEQRIQMLDPTPYIRK